MIQDILMFGFPIALMVVVASLWWDLRTSEHAERRAKLMERVYNG